MLRPKACGRPRGGADGGGQAQAAAGGRPLPVPDGFGIELDPATKQLSGDVLFGGSPARALRLSAAGQGALAELRAGPVSSAAGATLARRLTDAGLAHPRPPAMAAAPEITVLIPVRDRQQELDRCLAALGGAYPVLVVDDGSADQAATAGVAARHGARLIRRPVAGGPASARNTGLTAIAAPRRGPACTAHESRAGAAGSAQSTGTGGPGRTWSRCSTATACRRRIGSPSSPRTWRIR